MRERETLPGYRTRSIVNTSSVSTPSNRYTPPDVDMFAAHAAFVLSYVNPALQAHVEVDREAFETHAEQLLARGPVQVEHRPLHLPQAKESFR